MRKKKTPIKHIQLVSAILLLMAGLFLNLNASQTETGESRIQIVTSLPVETGLQRYKTQPTAEFWVRMFKNARKSIDIAQFYLSNQKGEKLEPVINEIIAAAKRGVKIRIMVGKGVNKEMLRKTAEVTSRLKGISNIDFAVFDWRALNNGIIHAKYFILDRRAVFVGSQNFDWRALTHIHETGVWIEDRNIASQLGAVFDLDWKFCKGNRDIYETLKPRKGEIKISDLMLLSSPADYNPPNTHAALDILLHLLRTAKKTVRVQLLNYSEKIYGKGKKEKYLILTKALLAAADRGIRIDMMVSNWFNKYSGIRTLKKLGNHRNINIKIITIPQYSRGFIPYARVIHSKVLRVDDDISWVGTSNWGHSYFIASRNIEILMRDKGIARTLDLLFDELWNGKFSDLIVQDKTYIPAKRN